MGQRFALGVAFKSLVERTARSPPIGGEDAFLGTEERGVSKTDDRVVRSRDENLCPGLEGGMRRTKEDRERMKGIL